MHPPLLRVPGSPSIWLSRRVAKMDVDEAPPHVAHGRSCQYINDTRGVKTSESRFSDWSLCLPGDVIRFWLLCAPRSSVELTNPFVLTYGEAGEGETSGYEGADDTVPKHRSALSSTYCRASCISTTRNDEPFSKAHLSTNRR